MTKRFYFTRRPLAAMLLSAALIGAAPAVAHDDHGDHDAHHHDCSAGDHPIPAAGEGASAVLGDLEITGGFVRETVPTARTGGGYLSIANTGDSDDVLVSAAADAAATTELHQMRIEDDVMVMRPLGEGIPVPAGETVTLAPGGLHLMFIDLGGPFVVGTSVPVTLGFAEAGEVEIELPVLARGDAAPTGGHGGHDH